MGSKGGRGYECRTIGGVDLYEYHDEVIDIHSGKEGFVGSAPGNIFVFNSDTEWDLCRPADFPRFGNLCVGHDGLPFGQDLSCLYSGVSGGMGGSFGHDSPVTRRTSPAKCQPNFCLQNVVYHIANSLSLVRCHSGIPKRLRDVCLG